MKQHEPLCRCRRRGRLGRLALTVALPALVPAAFDAAAQAAGGSHVVMDGTLNHGGAMPLQPASGVYQIVPGLGKQVGPNLFQSFAQFNLSSGETAAFSGPSSVHNVLARVTGGTSSNIDGTLRCTIPAANFYLINPSGVVFGPNASLDVSGSFAVTTANYLKMADGGTFSTTVKPGDSVLTSALPAAFGFLGKSPASLTVSGSTLSVPTGKSILAVAGAVQFSGAGVSAPGGRIGIVSAASPGTVSFDSSTLMPGAVTAPILGTVALTSDAVISTLGPTGGSIAVNCGSLALSGGSFIDSSTQGSGPSGVVTVRASGSVVVSGSDASGNDTGIQSASATGASGNAGAVTISAGTFQLLDGGYLDTSTSGPGRGGSIKVNVSGEALLSGADPLGSSSGLYADSNASGPSGNAGSITMTAGSLREQGGGTISSQTSGSGSGGVVTVGVSGQALLSGANSSGNASGIVVSSNATGAGGNAGSITLAADGLQMLAGAKILSQTYGSGSGGDVAVSVSGPAVLSGDCGIFAASNACGTGGRAGSVTLSAGSLQVLDGAVVSSSTSNSAAGGNVTVDVSGQVLLSEAAGSKHSAIEVNSGAGGNPGAVTLNAGSLQMQGGGSIESITLGAGSGGEVKVNVSGPVVLSGTDSSGTPSGIFTDSLTSGPGGKAGPISLTAGSLQVLGGALISSRTTGSGAGGEVSIDVSGAVTLSGAVSLGDQSGIVSDSLASGHGGNAGSVTLTAGSLQILGGAQVRSSTFGSGNGGNVTVNVPGQALLSGADATSNDSGIYADSRSTGGNGSAGSISLTAGSLQVMGGAQVSSSTSGAGKGGDVTAHVSNQVLLSGADAQNDASGLFATAQTGSAGDAGAISLTAGNLQIMGAAKVDSSTSGSGNGGKVTLNVSGQALLSGAISGNDVSGVFADSSSTGQGGDAGSITFTAGSLKVSDSARISSSTVSLGRGGDVTVHVMGLALLDGPGPFNSDAGIFATSGSGRSGDSGSITLTAGSLQVLGGAQVTTATFGSGNGNALTVSVSGQTLLSGVGPSGSPSGIFAETNAPTAGGNAGTVRITSGSLQVLAGATVSSSTFGSGSSQDVVVNVSGPALVSGVGSRGDSGVFAAAHGTGNAGSIFFNAASLAISNGGVINCSTDAHGNGGNVAVDAGNVRLFGTGRAGIFAASYNTSDGGDGGTITVSARSLAIAGTGAISAETFGPGSAKSVTIHAGSASLSGPQATIDSRSTGIGTAGTVTLKADTSLLVNKASLEVDAGVAHGGDLLVTGADLIFHGGRLLANSGGGNGGGSITLKARDQVLLLGTQVRTQGGGNGGNITVDPLLVTLDRAVLNANGGINGGNISIHPDVLLKSGGSLSASGNLGVSGSVALTPPDVDLAGSLVALPGSLVSPGATLARQCAQKLGAFDMSSFLVTGKGGIAPDPGGWLPDSADPAGNRPDWILLLTPNRTGRDRK